MRKYVLTQIAFLVALVLLFSGQAIAQDATEIVRKADQKMRGETSYVEMTMKIVRPDWTREMSLKSWSKGTELSLILVTAPARDKGTAYLKRQNDLWNWVPSIDRMIKIPPSMMMQSWMGSDFTNDDLVKESSIVEDYQHQIVGQDTLQGYACHKIEMTPKPDAAVVWGKVLIWISIEEYYQLKAEYYDEDGELVQTMHLYDIQQLGDRKIPTRLEMIPADADKEGQKTVLLYEDAEFNMDIDDSFFSQQNMKRVR